LGGVASLQGIERSIASSHHTSTLSRNMLIKVFVFTAAGNKKKYIFTPKFTLCTDEIIYAP